MTDENLPLIARKFLEIVEALLHNPIKYGVFITFISNTALYFATTEYIAMISIFASAFGILIAFLGCANKINQFYINQENIDDYKNKNMSTCENILTWNPEKIELRPNT